MFTKTFTLDRHIEELRAELRSVTDAEEAFLIKAELDAMVRLAGGSACQQEARV